jgi:serine/threonine protein kinase
MGTLLYMSPESLNNKVLLSSDVYSCGIVLYIMATRRIPFIYKNESELMQKIERGDIIRKCTPLATQTCLS